MEDTNVHLLKQFFTKNKSRIVENFTQFLSFKTISADASTTSEFTRCTQWLKERLESLGAHVDILNHGPHPIVMGTITSEKADAPTVLIYNHYDVQPVEPLKEWKSDPFVATFEQNTVFARGASDDKGQAMCALTALEALREQALPCHVKILLDSEEEVGSPTLSRLCEQNEPRLRADYVIVMDLGMRTAGVPAIPLGTRGIVALSLTLKGANQDLHSGTYGGVVPNPIHATVRLLASLHKEDGSVAVPGFYDRVHTSSLSEKLSLDLTMDEENLSRELETSLCGGERGFSPTERAWLRPTLEINGIGAGHTGEGSKTVIPKEVTAKISCRLVPDQDPMEIAEKVRDFLLSEAPQGITCSVEIHEGMGKAFRVNTQGKAVRALEKAIEAVWTKSPEKILEGGSIPILPLLEKASGGELLAWGVGEPGDHIHAPNEQFDLSRLEKGFITLVLLTHEISKGIHFPLHS